LPWDQTRDNLSNDVNRVAPGPTPAGGASGPAPAGASGPAPAVPLAPETGTLKEQLVGQDGVYGKWSASTTAVSKGWHDLLAPSPATPPAPPGQEAVQEAQKVAKTVRLVQQTIASVMGIIAMPKEMLDVGFANLTAPLAALFPSLPSATLTTLYLGTPHAHLHPPSLIPPAPPVPLPSMGPVTLGTCVRVLITGLPAARCKDLGYAFTCGGLAPIFQIKTGSSNVFIGGHRAARTADVCVACVKGESRSVEAGAFLAALGKAAAVAATALQVAGMAAGLAGVVADATEAAVEDDAAMASAKALAATMGAAQMAADAVAMALSQAMGTDPGVPPSIGALLVGHPTVLIGGFPMIDIPNPIDLLLNRLSRFKAKSPPDEEKDAQTQPKSCPI
jgi:uncharacterized Zn-binding protein involved in type VI secretion